MLCYLFVDGAYFREVLENIGREFFGGDEPTVDFAKFGQPYSKDRGSGSVARHPPRRRCCQSRTGLGQTEGVPRLGSQDSGGGASGSDRGIPRPSRETRLRTGGRATGPHPPETPPLLGRSRARQAQGQGQGFQGRLVEGQVRGASHPGHEQAPRAPRGVVLGNRGSTLSVCLLRSSAKAFEKGEVPVIRMGNIVDGGFDLTELKFLPSAHEEFPDLLLQPGDLLFNRTNSAELVGKTAIYHGAPTPCSFASYLICVRVLDNVESGWMCHAINSLYGRLWIASVVTQQVGQANVNGTKLKAFVVPLPPLVEQQRLLSLMDELFSKCEASRASVVIELRRVSRLRQSILKWAFDGKLVDQDPSDEPAERVLARIRAERAVAPTKKSRGRTTKVAT
jgi:hypothetical protein